MEQKSEETQTQQEPQETQQQAKKDRKYLVIDTSTFIKETQFDRFNASELYTVDEVLREVRDKKARKYLVSIPFRIKVREPSPEAIKAVISFAQKTGDYGSLSSTDIKVMALTYTFEAEQYGTANIRTSPKPYAVVEHGRTPAPSEASSLNGDPKQDQTDLDGDEEDDEEDNEEEEGEEQPKKTETTTQPPKQEETKKQETQPTQTKVEESKTQTQTQQTQTQQTQTQIPPQPTQPQTQTRPRSNSGSSHASSTTSSKASSLAIPSENKPLGDDDGWITPDNINEMNRAMKQLSFQTDIDHKVGCLTCDFAMQNVLLQMGLNVISIDGMKIRSLRQFVLRCYACNNIIKDTSKQFCARCGYATLRKVPVSIGEDGTLTLILNPAKHRVRLQGSKYTAPAPRHGRNANNLILREDVWKEENRKLHRGNKKENDPDALFASSSRSQDSNLAIGYGRKNPNISRPKVGKRNKTKMQQ